MDREKLAKLLVELFDDEGAYITGEDDLHDVCVDGWLDLLVISDAILAKLKEG